MLISLRQCCKSNMNSNTNIIKKRDKYFGERLKLRNRTPTLGAVDQGPRKSKTHSNTCSNAVLAFVQSFYVKNFPLSTCQSWFWNDENYQRWYPVEIRPLVFCCSPLHETYRCDHFHCCNHLHHSGHAPVLSVPELIQFVRNIFCCAAYTTIWVSGFTHMFLTTTIGY